MRKGATKKVSKATRISRKNTKTKDIAKWKDSVRKKNRFVNSWAFGQLQKFIVYKALLAGIRVTFVNPKDTSKECPVCHALNNANDRDYYCGCGFHKHRNENLHSLLRRMSNINLVIGRYGYTITGGVSGSTTTRN